MKAVIMAGGKGSRLRPLTCHLPKPMVPLLNRPCMEYIIELLRSHGITQIAVTTHYLPELIRNHFGDGREFGVELHYFEETVPLGTAGSVKNAQSFLDERFVVVSGDALTDFDLRRAAEFHERKGALATIVLTRVEHPLEYGLVMTDGDGRVVRMLEKPDWSEVFGDTVNTGIYVLEPGALDRVAEGREYDFSNELFPLLMREHEPLYGYVSDGYWSDIGHLAQYRQAQFDMLNGRVKVGIKGKKVAPGVYVGDGVVMPSGVRWTGPAYIGDGTVLEEGVEIGPYCIVGSGNRICRGSTLRHAVVWDHNHIAENNEIDGATLGSQVRCLPGSVFADGAVVGSHCTIGPNAHVKPQVKIWPRKRIREHAMLHTSVVWGEGAAKSLFVDGAVRGRANAEMTPEFAAKFAGAYGASLAKGMRLAVSASPDEFARLIATVIAASLRAVGVHVIDAGELNTAAARFAVREGNADGGIHVQSGGDDGGVPLCVMECMDADGKPIAKSAERKVDNAYAQDDFPRADADAPGDAERADGWAERYVRKLIAELRGAETRPLRVAVAAPDALAGSAFARIAESCGWRAAFIPPENGDAGMAAAIAESGADFGVRFESGGQTMRLYDEKGEPVPHDRTTVLQAMAFFHCCRGRTIGIPLSAPSFLDSSAEALGNRVVRTKRSPRAVLEGSPDLRFHPLFDAPYAAGLLARNIAESGMSVTQMLGFLPPFSLYRTTIEVPWEAKGKLMRRIMEQTEGQRVELLDGIKLYDEQGWVLLLPEPDEPAFTLIAHGEEPGAAERLADRYSRELIQSIP